jgi:hypothetical protein
MLLGKINARIALNPAARINPKNGSNHELDAFRVFSLLVNIWINCIYLKVEDFKLYFCRRV